MNLVEALGREIARVGYLTRLYEEIGDSGKFGLIVLNDSLAGAFAALASGDAADIDQGLLRPEGARMTKYEEARLKLAESSLDPEWLKAASPVVDALLDPANKGDALESLLSSTMRDMPNFPEGPYGTRDAAIFALGFSMGLKITGVLASPETWIQRKGLEAAVLMWAEMMKRLKTA